MKKIFTLLTLLLCAITSSWADDVIFSWSSTSGDAVASVTNDYGTITGISSGTTTEATVNVSQSNFKVLKCQGKADFTTNHIKVTLKSGVTLKTGDKLTVNGFSNNGSKDSYPSFKFSSSYTVTFDTEAFANMNSSSSNYNSGNLNDAQEIELGSGANGVSEFLITRGSTGTNFYVTSVVITRPGASTTTTVNAPTVGNTAILDNSGAISGSKSDPFVAYKMAYSALPFTIECTEAVASETIQAGSDNYKFTISGNDYTPAKFAASRSFIVKPNAGVTITAVEAYARSNVKDKTSHIASGSNGTDLEARGNTSTTFASPAHISLVTNGEGYYYFTITGQQAIVALEVTYSTSENVSVKVSSAGYATLFYDKKLAIPTGVTAYYATVKDASTILLTEIDDVIPANTGAVLKASAGTYKFVVTEDAVTTDVSTNILTGVTTATAVSANTVYTLGQNGEGVVGLRLYSGTSIRAYSAYATSISTARQFYEIDLGGDLDGGVTAIKNIKVGTEDNIYYDLNGRRVLYPTKGLYIVNGKKVVIK